MKLSLNLITSSLMIQVTKQRFTPTGTQPMTITRQLLQLIVSISLGTLLVGCGANPEKPADGGVTTTETTVTETETTTDSVDETEPEEKKEEEKPKKTNTKKKRNR